MSLNGSAAVEQKKQNKQTDHVVTTQISDQTATPESAMSNNHDKMSTEGLGSKQSNSNSSTKLAFSLSKKSKKAKKSSKIANEFGHDEKDSTIVSNHDMTPSEPLVIPVQEDARKSLQEQARLKRLEQESKEDLAAIQALESEAQSGLQDQASSSSSKMIIASNTDTFQRGNDKGTIDGSKRDDDKEQLKQDLERLAEDVDVESDSYRAVPIQDFGAALLRGMGWTGTQSTKEDDPVLPRPSRLGLGATPKILDDLNLATHSRRPRRQDQVQREQKLKQQQEEYKLQQQAKLAMDKQRTMQEGSIVYVGRDDGANNRRRAVLRQLQGVPGLNMVLVQMEGASDTSKVKKGEIELVDRSDLETRPFLVSKSRESFDKDDAKKSGRTSKLDDDTDRKRRRRERDESEEDRQDRRRGSDRRKRDSGRGSRSESDTEENKYRQKKSNEMDRRQYSGTHERSSASSRYERNERRRSHSPDDYRRSKDRSRKRLQETDRVKEEKAKKRRRDNGAASSGTAKPHSTWVIPNIRVRVVTEKYGRRHYKQKGIVVDVTYKGMTTLKMDHNGQLLQLSERYLETALPKVGGNAIVLTGDNRLAKGRLLERDSRACKGVIQAFEDMNILTLSLDDMAEWVGPLDDDLLE